MIKNKSLASISRVESEFGSPFVLIFGLSTIPMFLIQSVRKYNLPRAENWDRALYFLACLVGLIVLLNINKIRAKKRVINFACCLAIYAEFIGTIGIEQHPGMSLSESLWMGFGPFVFFLMMFFGSKALLIYLAALDSKHQKTIRLISGITIFAAVLSFFQTRRSLISVSDVIYNINEFLAPSAGYLPFHIFIPQYGGWIPFIIMPFKFFFNAEELVKLALYMAFASVLLVLAISINDVRNSLPNRSISLATLLVVPLVAITQFPTRIGNGGSIALLLSALPVRIFGGIVVITISLWIIKKILFQQSTGFTKSASFLGGIFSGVTFWTNQDFILTALVVSFALLFALPRFLSMKKSQLRKFWLAGIISGIASYPVILFVVNAPIKVNLIGFFQRQFSSGFGSEPIYSPGPVFLILPLILGLIGTHINLLKQHMISKESANSTSIQIQISSITGLGHGLWALLGFVYYLNRSFASGQLQILLTPVAVSLGTLIGSSLTKIDFSRQFDVKIDKLAQAGLPATRVHRDWKTIPTLHSAAFGMVLILPLASIIALPNPNIELRRVLRPGIQSTWPTPSLKQTLRDTTALTLSKEVDLAKIGYFGAAPSFVKLSTGIPSALIYNMPSDIEMSDVTKREECLYLLNSKYRFLLLGDDSKGEITGLRFNFCKSVTLRKTTIIPSGNLVEIVKGEEK